ncbi:MAG: TRAP transporter small permease [Bacillota bacterium]
MKKIAKALDKTFSYLTAASFVLVGVCVLIQIVTRYTPGISAPWTDETTRLLFMYTMMAGAPMAIKYREYAVIDMLLSNLNGKVRHAMLIFEHLVISAVGVVGAWQAYIFFTKGLKTLSTSLQINMGFFYVVPVGIFALTTLYSLALMVEEAMAMGKGE